jgi:hypothetical protein
VGGGLWPSNRPSAEGTYLVASATGAATATETTSGPTVSLDDLAVAGASLAI